jgi:tRNA modification GTPase
MARAVAARDVSAVVLVVLDRSLPLTADDRRLLMETELRPRAIVANKSDLPAAWDAGEIPGSIEISAKTGAGLDILRGALSAALTSSDRPRDVPAITNIRHVDLVTRARDALLCAEAAASAATPEEFVLLDLNEARERLEEVTGRRTLDDVLQVIFDKFCIGK